MTIMISGTNSLSSKCGAYHRWVTNGLICTDWLLFPLKTGKRQPQCTRQECAMVLYPIKYQKHVKQQEVIIMNLERELKAAREEIYKLKTGIVISNFMKQENSGIWEKPKHSESRFERFSANDAVEV